MIQTFHEIPVNSPMFGSIARRSLPDGRCLTVMEMVFGKGRLCIAESPDALEYYDAWCYENLDVALFALAVWDGEGDPPIGWHRQISTGRRREIGNPRPETEYVAG